ncbi:unnamed protein product [Cylicostephanus goldi]|uniref:Major facilitator superfamily (MFS) profile domain-containing protein n=1 Tax=Cylicostephanus goldi TaxID=71465 RepID=A0A3P7QBD6_CYLGO|nr:unnamed protein product [Cylicostephanus goldi]
MIPGINGMLTGWIPSHEKSTAASLFTSGNQLAGVIGNPVAAELCASRLQWPAVFYSSGENFDKTHFSNLQAKFTGVLGFLWCIVWQLTVNNSPANTKWISDHELIYLEHHLPEKTAKRMKKVWLVPLNLFIIKKVLPWRSMLTSAPLLVVFYSSIVGNMMIAMILVYIPVYFKDVLMLEVKQRGSLPHASYIMFCSILNHLLPEWFLYRSTTYLQPHFKIDLGVFDGPSQAKEDTHSNPDRKALTTMLTLSVCFLLLAYGVDCSTHVLALVLLSTIGAAFGLSISGFLTSLLSLSPNFIGVISSISQIIGG